MPSFFRSAEDVRIFFLKETDTPEKKKQYDRLKTIFSQSIRRGGVKGSFWTVGSQATRQHDAQFDLRKMRVD